MDHVWVICAEFAHETKPTKLDPYTHVLFVTEEYAEQELNGCFGETVAECASLDTKNDPELDGYWLNDVLAERVPLAPILAMYRQEA